MAKSELPEDIKSYRETQSKYVWHSIERVGQKIKG